MYDGMGKIIAFYFWATLIAGALLALGLRWLFIHLL
jgi:hypothetical protein